VSLIRQALHRRPVERMTLEDYVELTQFAFQGNSYPLTGTEQTLASSGVESSGGGFVSLVHGAYAASGVVFACMLARQLAFSSARFRWQRMRGGSGSDLFGSPALGLLERPWPGGTTQDLLSRMIQDADLAGNAYVTRNSGELVRLRPDWVDIAAVPRLVESEVLGWRRVGYVYTEGGRHSGADPVSFLATEVAHFAPIPDPLANFRGMSWLTPVVREVKADREMTAFKDRFFVNGATPNMVIKHAVGADEARILAFKKRLEAEHSGALNAFKTLHLYPGADLTVVGADMQKVDFKSVQGAGETRIAAAARVPAVIAGISEGLQGSSLNQGNFGAARRQFVDGTLHPLWQNAAGSLAQILPSPGADSRLWYDAADVPLLREDERDAADIAFTEAQTLRQLIDAGYTPESAAQALLASDWRLLQHSGLYSVQLQPAGVTAPPASEGVPGAA
jgi:phage portal protein BeeE